MIWRTRPWVRDAATVVLVLTAELGGFPHTGLDVWGVLIAAGAAGLMPARRRYPIIVAGLVGVLYVVGTQPPSYDAPVSAMLIALYTVGRYTPAPASITMATLAVAGGWVVHDLPSAIAGSSPAIIVPLALIPASPLAVLTTSVVDRGLDQ